MLTKDEYLLMGDEYLTLDEIARQMLDYIKDRGAIDLDDLETFHIITADQLSDEEWDELDNDKLEKFYLDALIGYGFIEKFNNDGWKIVCDRPNKVEQLVKVMNR